MKKRNDGLNEKRRFSITWGVRARRVLCRTAEPLERFRRTSSFNSDFS